MQKNRSDFDQHVAQASAAPAVPRNAETTMVTRSPALVRFLRGGPLAGLVPGGSERP